MLVDWFTVGAQVLNFVILVWLLKRFLYKPILDAVDAREQRIASELAEADEDKAAAQQERAEFQLKNQEFDQQRAALFVSATDEAGAERRRLLEEARATAAALSVTQLETLRETANNLSAAISRRAQQEVFAIARSALLDLATTSLEERVAEVFIRRLQEMDEQPKAVFSKALQTAAEPALVRSAFELPQAQRETVRQAINTAFGADIALRFATAPDMVSGIELITDGQRLAWSIGDYLTALERSVSELLREPTEPTSKPTGDGQ